QSARRTATTFRLGRSGLTRSALRSRLCRGRKDRSRFVSCLLGLLVRCRLNRRLLRECWLRGRCLCGRRLRSLPFRRGWSLRRSGTCTCAGVLGRIIAGLLYPAPLLRPFGRDPFVGGQQDGWGLALPDHVVLVSAPAITIDGFDG